MTALTQKTSGRLFAILLALGMMATFLFFVALRPAGAVDGEGYTNLGQSAVCAHFLGADYEGETAVVPVPRGGNNDRVFETTVNLDRGASIALSLVNNRKDLSFTILNGTVEGVALVDSNQGNSGLFYAYVPPVDAGEPGGSATYTSTGNVKSIVICYTPFYEGVLACDGTDSEVADEDGDRASFVEVIRLQTGKPDCNVLLPYTLDITPNEVKFLFPDEFADENFFIRIDWAVSVGTADEILIGSVRQVAVDDVNFAPVQACADNDLGPGEVPVLTDPPTVTHPAEVPICLVAQVLNGTQTQWYSGQFDPQWR